MIFTVFFPWSWDHWQIRDWLTARGCGLFGLKLDWKRRQQTIDAYKILPPAK